MKFYKMDSLVINEILWNVYYSYLTGDNYKVKLNISYFFTEEKRFLRKPKVTLYLVSPTPGVVIGMAGIKINQVEKQIFKRCPFINEIKIIESVCVDSNPRLEH